MDTPRTDAKAKELESLPVEWKHRYLGMDQHARELENEIAELRHQIWGTIMENLHLADGSDCTLKRLKDAISFELEDSYENDQEQSMPDRKGK